MVWSLRSTTTLSIATRSNSAPTCPAGVTAGDILYVVQYQEDNAGVAVTPPTGFVALNGGENAASTPDAQFRHWYKVADGNEAAGDGDLDFTHGSVYCGMACACFTPTVLTPALDVQGASISTSTASPLTIAAITTTVADTLVLAGVINFDEQDTSPPSSPWAQAVEVSGFNGGGPFIGWKEQAAAGTTGTAAHTWTGSPVATVGLLSAYKPGVASNPRALPRVIPVTRPGPALAWRE